MSEPAGAADEPSSTAWPILVALGLTVLVVVGVIVARMLRGDEITDEAGVGRAVVGQNDALQRQDYPAFRRYTCIDQQGAEATVLADQQKSADAKGARVVDDLRALQVDGDRATATVVYHFEKAADDKVTATMSFAREDGQWTVCSPGPR